MTHDIPTHCHKYLFEANWAHSASAKKHALWNLFFVGSYLFASTWKPMTNWIDRRMYDSCLNPTSCFLFDWTWWSRRTWGWIVKERAFRMSGFHCLLKSFGQGLILMGFWSHLACALAGESSVCPRKYEIELLFLILGHADSNLNEFLPCWRRTSGSD